jgi:uncharacterized protein YeaO (DUF488 family)
MWAKELAPSTKLRKWFNHDPQRWDEFRTRYRAELAQRTSELAALSARCANRCVTLLFGAKDTEHNQAVVLKEILENGDPVTRA